MTATNAHDNTGRHEQQMLDWFTFHPANEKTGPIHDEIRNRFQDLAAYLIAIIPPSADRTTALRALRAAMYEANATVACESAFRA